MAQTQKIYLGETPVIKNYFGDNPIVSAIESQFEFIPYTLEYLVIAGGGNGGNSSGIDGGGGGGAGGLLSGSYSIVDSQVYQIKAGGGTVESYFTGSGLYFYSNAGGIGGDAGSYTGASGGSGGGGGAGSGLFGAGIVGQGNNGATANSNEAGGGGGAGGAGGLGGNRRNAGAGLSSSISGTSVTYAVGAAGKTNNGIPRTEIGAGGLGGSNLGTSTGGNGTGGIVIIRYLGPQKATGGTVTTDGSYVIHTFSNTTSTFNT